jgi:predicted Zn-dependent protease
MILTAEQAKIIVDKILSASKAEAVRVSINAGRTANVRFARNTVTTSGASEDMSASITATFGKKNGSYSFNQFDEKTLLDAVRKAEELAKLAPDDPEYMPPIGPQQYPDVKAWFDSTSNLSPDARAKIAGEALGMADGKKLIAAGFIENESNFRMLANSQGLRAFHTSTGISFSMTARTPDGTGSGWASGGHNDSALLDGASVSKTAIDKGTSSVNPKAVEPGKYTVILEPEAVSNLMGNLAFSMDARSADEGRSFFSEAGGKNKIGQKIFPDFVNLISDPAYPGVPGSPWGEDGLPTAKTPWIENGVVRNLRYSRYWAQQKNTAPVPSPANTIMPGGTGTVEDLIASTEKGILVTRFWYIRGVDPKTVLLTGLTRDGTFWIENGKIAYPIKNFRFNESPIAMLKNIEMMSKSVRLQNGGSANLIPALKVKEFTFSSMSDAV